MRVGFLCLVLVGCGVGPKEAGDLHQSALPKALEPFVFEDPGVLESPRTSSPIALTASDGTGLQMQALRVRANVSGPLAFTELRLTFKNPLPRQLEGRFSIRLPDGASISRLAMKIHGRWMEGEVVQRQRARVVYERFLHRRKDPALLEHGSGNLFTARVFPIPANATKELIISYSQELLPSRAPLRVPLLGLPKIGEIDAKVTLETPSGPKSIFSLQKNEWTPDVDIVLDPPPSSGGLRNGDLVVMNLQPDIEVAPDPVERLFIMVDTSASRAAHFSRQALLVKRLIEGLAKGNNAKVALAAFDQETSMIYEGPAQSFSMADFERLVSRRALGATDFEGALRWLQNRLSKSPGGYTRLLLVTDGAVTAGGTEGALESAVRSLAWVGVERLDTLAVGGFRDRAQLQSLVRAGLRRDGVVIDGRSAMKTIGERLVLGTRSGLGVTVKGARWVWPDKLDGLQPNDHVLVYADLPEGLPLEVALNGRPQKDAIQLASVDSALLERAWIKAKMNKLAAERAALPKEAIAHKSAIAKTITGLSVKHRVLSPYTALMVLETERDYRRFGIDRKAKVNILAFDDDRMVLRMASRGADKFKRDERRHRAETGRMGLGVGGFGRGADTRGDQEVPEAPRELGANSGVLSLLKTDPSQVSNIFGDGGLGTGIGDLLGTALGDAGGAGGLGLRGTGGGGGGMGIGGLGTGRGAGSGIGGIGGTGHSGQGGFGKRNRPQIRVRAGRPQVKGSLDKEIIRRVIRRHFARFRYCYEKQLQRQPNLRGKMVVRFIIAPNGSVQNAQVQRSTLGSKVVEGCVVRVFRTLRFPATKGGGVVIVNYPLVFNYSGEVPRAVRPAPLRAPRPEPPTRPLKGPAPYEGRFAKVKALLKEGKIARAMDAAKSWREEAPGDVLALIALGETAQAQGNVRLANRAFGSIIDLFPTRAELRRHAGARLESVGTSEALALAVDTYRRAVEDRPDHPSGHRALAYAQIKNKDPSSALDTIMSALDTSFRGDRFPGVYRVLKEDTGLIAAALIKSKPDLRASVLQRLTGKGLRLPSRATTRFVLHWETDASDVNMHIVDARSRYLNSYTWGQGEGWALYGNVINGYGPEVIAVHRDAKRLAYPMDVWVRYMRQRASGYTLGKMQIVQHDGSGGLAFSERPFAIMKRGAAVELGSIKGPLPVEAP